MQSWKASEGGIRIDWIALSYSGKALRRSVFSRHGIHTVPQSAARSLS